MGAYIAPPEDTVSPTTKEARTKGFGNSTIARSSTRFLRSNCRKIFLDYIGGNHQME